MRAALIVLVGICGAVVTLVLAPAGKAGQPVTQPLNPAPPSFETCKTVGNGFICEGSLEAEPYGPNDTGIACGSGAGTFDAIDQGLEDVHAIRYYDANGDLVKRVLDDHEVGALSNPLTGASIPYSLRMNNTDVLAVPGDLGSLTETTTGNQNVTVPGMGNVVLEAGRVVFDAGLIDLEFSAGHHDYGDYYYYGDTSAMGELCAALGA